MKRADSVDLLILFVATVVAISGGLSGGLLRGLAGLLLIFVLPGYALTALAFPRAMPRVVESLVYTLGLSLAVTILTGLVLNATVGGLQAQSWVVTLGVFSLAFGVAAWLRRQGQFTGRPLTLPTTINPITPILVGLAVIIAGLALVVARNGAEARTTPGFTQFWMLPTTPGTVQLGVRNEETAPLTYRVVMTGAGQVIQEWATITVKPGEQWEATLPLPNTPYDKIDAALYRLDSPQSVYRKASLYLGGSSGALCVWREGLCEF